MVCNYVLYVIDTILIGIRCKITCSFSYERIQNHPKIGW